MQKFGNPLFKYIGVLVVGTILGFITSDPFSDYRHILSNILYTFVYWEGAWQITSIFRRKYNTYAETGKRILFQALSITVYVITANLLLCLIISGLIYYHEIRFTWNMYIGTLQASLFVTFLITAIYEAQNFFELWKQETLETGRLKEENLRAQFQMLKNQVNPHFLFNSLNTLAALIPEDPDKAVDFVQKLSSLYRYILQYRDKETVSLDTELQSIEAYLFLQSIRFGESLQWTLQINGDLAQKELPPLTLQLLVENAVKHNIVSRNKPLHIEILAEKNLLTVRNNLQEKRNSEPSTHLGLHNLTERYALISHSHIEIQKSDTHFTVIVPLL